MVVDSWVFHYCFEQLSLMKLYNFLYLVYCIACYNFPMRFLRYYWAYTTVKYWGIMWLQASVYSKIYKSKTNLVSWKFDEIKSSFWVLTIFKWLGTSYSTWKYLCLPLWIKYKMSFLAKWNSIWDLKIISQSDIMSSQLTNHL